MACVHRFPEWPPSCFQSAMNKALVAGYFSSQAQAEKAMNALCADGFPSHDVSVLYPQNTQPPERAAAGFGAMAWLAGIGALSAGTVDSGILVSVQCDNAQWVKRARNILKTSGA